MLTQVLAELATYRPAHFISYSRETYDALIAEFSRDFSGVSVSLSFILTTGLLLFVVKRTHGLCLLWIVSGLLYLFFAVFFHYQRLAFLSPMAYGFSAYFVIMAVAQFILAHNAYVHRPTPVVVFHRHTLCYRYWPGLLLIAGVVISPYTDLGLRDDLAPMLSLGLLLLVDNLRYKRMLVLVNSGWFLSLGIYF